MPNIKSSIRSVKTDAERNARNSQLKSAVHTASRKVAALAKEGKTEDAKAALKVASSLIDKAAHKNVIHKNSAARKKSNLAKKVNTK